MSSLVEGALPCTDMHGQLILHNEMYIPGPDECMQCQCVNGRHSNCKSVLCAPPRECHKYQVGKRCCEFTCVDDAPPISTYGDSSTDIGLRLVASAVTAVLSLALLLFLVYRLRQRRHRVPAQLRAEDTYNLTLMNYLRGSGYLGHGQGGYRGGSNEFYYEEPPPPYSLWKTGSESAGEAPPPYSEAVAAPELRQSQRREPGGRVHAILVVAGAERAACTLPAARRRCDVLVRRPLPVRPTLDEEEFPGISPPDYCLSCEPAPDAPAGSGPQLDRRSSGPHCHPGGRAGGAPRRGHQRSQSQGTQRAENCGQRLGRGSAGVGSRGSGREGSQGSPGPGGGRDSQRERCCSNPPQLPRRHRRSGSDHGSNPEPAVEPAACSHNKCNPLHANHPPNPPPSYPNPTANPNHVDLAQYLTSLSTASRSQPPSRDVSDPHNTSTASSQCLESGEYLPPTLGPASSGASAEYSSVAQRRRQCRAQAEQALQRFSLQLSLDCSGDSTASSTPTVTPDGARAGSLTSSSSAETEQENSG